MTTQQQYKNLFTQCKEVFLKKTQDYGPSWRILRTSSLTDQIFIKAKRIRNLQESGQRQVDEGMEPEFKGIVNYCIIALIQLETHLDESSTLSDKEVERLYEKKRQAAQELMKAKNHDYGEAWRDMRVSSLTDLILMRILRIKKIEDNEGETLVSEGIDSNYYDIINYAIFALIKLQESNENSPDH